MCCSLKQLWSGIQKLSLKGRIWATAIQMQMHSLKDQWCAARDLLRLTVHTELCEEGTYFLELISELVLHKTGLCRQPTLTTGTLLLQGRQHR